MSRFKFMDFSKFVKRLPLAVADSTTLLPSYLRPIFLWALSIPSSSPPRLPAPLPPPLLLICPRLDSSHLSAQSHRHLKTSPRRNNNREPMSPVFVDGQPQWSSQGPGGSTDSWLLSASPPDNLSWCIVPFHPT